MNHRRRSGRRGASIVRRLGICLLAAAVGVTLWSVVVNAVTDPPATLTAPSGQDVQVGGVRVHYQKWGSTGSPIVLIGGFAEHSVSWSLVGPLLATDHQVYAVDLAGYGYTEFTGHYTLADQTSLVSGFVQTMKLNRPLLVGHSLGAAVVGSVAVEHPDLIEGVIFADGDALPFGGGNGRAGPPSWVLNSPYVTTLYRLGTRWSWLDEQIVKGQCGSVCKGYSPQLVAAWMRPMRQGEAEQAMLDMASRPMLALTPAQIRSITVPRGIIWGTEDASSGGSLAGAKANLGNPPTVLIEHAGHLSMIADPPAFAAAVEKLAALSAR